MSCDFCGDVVVGKFDFISKGGKEMHFCRTKGCWDEYVFEHYVRDRVEEALEPRVREEFKLIHDRVCPACRYRLQKLL